MPRSKDSYEEEVEAPRVDEYEPDDRAQKGDEPDDDEDIDDDDIVEEIDLDDLSAMEGPDS